MIPTMKYILPALLLFPLHDLEAQDQIDVVPWTCADGYEAYYVSIAPDTVLVPYMASWTSGPPVRTLLICITGDCTNAGLITNQTHDTLEIGWSGMWGWYLEDFWLNLQIFDGVNYSVSDAYFTTTENAPDTLSIDVPTVVQTPTGDSLAWVLHASNWGIVTYCPEYVTRIHTTVTDSMTEALLYMDTVIQTGSLGVFPHAFGFNSGYNGPPRTLRLDCQMMNEDTSAVPAFPPRLIKTAEPVYISIGALSTGMAQATGTTAMVLPNPFHDQFTLRTSGPGHYAIMNTKGIIVASGWTDGEVMILAPWDPGVYMLTFTDGEGHRALQRIVCIY